MAILPEYKDPSATILLGLDWSDFLSARGDDTISESEWTAYKLDTAGDREETDELTFSGSAHNDTGTSVKCAGGTLPSGWEELDRDPDYWATNRITTAGGLTEERSIPIFMVEQ